MKYICQIYFIYTFFLELQTKYTSNVFFLEVHMKYTWSILKAYLISVRARLVIFLDVVVHLADRLPMKKLKSLLKKTQKLRLFVWKGILKNTPLSFRIHCYVKNRNDLHLNRNRSNCKSVRSLLRAKHELVRKQGKVYLSSKHKRRGYLGGWGIKKGF